MIDQSIAALIFIGIALGSIGINMTLNSAYDVPPIPAGWLVGVIFVDVGGAFILTGGLSSRIFKVRKKFYGLLILIGGTLLGLGIRNMTNNPLETTECPCDPGFFSRECLQCPACDPVYSKGCNDGALGNGECECEVGWGGPTCSVCAETFTGLTCDECKRGWDGLACDRCYPGYTGASCDRCDVGWIEDSDELGILCDRCEPGRWGGYCKPCPNCKEDDSLATCKDNDWYEANVYEPDVCTVTSNICTNKYDCSSLNCKGQCVFGSTTDGTMCETSQDCQIGWNCEYKTCCLEDRLGDGTCKCGRNGYAGPLCQRCPGFDGVYSSSICGGHGTCQAAYAGSGEDERFVELRCECVPEGVEPFPAWTGDNCGCLKNTEADATCAKCANGAFGPNCNMCPGGQGISQCSRHGSCSDGVDGDGTCDCDIDIKYSGLGGWGGGSCTSCYSGEFYGNRCEVCPATIMVGCHTSSFLTTLPGSGNCITSCGSKTCNAQSGVCV
jgi:hypothetical protein